MNKVKISSQMTYWWAAQWYSKNRLDGETKHFLFENGLPKLFRRRAECRAWIKEKWGYIADRPDLKAEPFGWHVPRVVKVIIEVVK